VSGDTSVDPLISLCGAPKMTPTYLIQLSTLIKSRWAELNDKQAVSDTVFWVALTLIAVSVLIYCLHTFVNITNQLAGLAVEYTCFKTNCAKRSASKTFIEKPE
jgi:hypothetical protein